MLHAVHYITSVLSAQVHQLEMTDERTDEWTMLQPAEFPHSYLNGPVGVSTVGVVLVWKCLNGTAPSYLSELCVPVASASGRQHLRSASNGLLQVPGPKP